MKKLIKIEYILTGLAIVGISWCLLAVRNYFYYPPQYAPLWNDLRLDSAGFILGLLLILYGIFESKFKTIKQRSIVGTVLLFLCSFFVAVMLILFLIHSSFAGAIKFTVPEVLLGFLLLQLMVLAYFRNSNY